MIYRFTLNNSVLGSLVISEPDGWEDAKLKLERDKNFHSLVEYFDGSFIFYGNNGTVNGGYDYIDDVDRTQGIDAVLEITIELSLNGYTYTTLFTGLVKMDSIVRLGNNMIQAAIVRNDFWSKFINRLETPVNIQSEESLDGDVMNVFESVNLSLTSQKVQQKHLTNQNNYYRPIGQDWPEDFTDPDFQIELNTNRIAQVVLNDIEFDEIKENHNIPSGVIPSGAEAASMFTFEYAGDYEFDIKYSITALWTSTAFAFASGYHNLSGDSGDPGPPSDPNFTGKMWIQFNEEEPIEFTATHKEYTFSVNDPDAVDPDWDQTNGWTEFTYQATRSINKGDSVRVWFENTGDEFGYGNNTFTILVYQFFILGSESNDITMQPSLEALYPGNSLYTDLAFTPPYHAMWKDFGNPEGCESFFRITAQTVFPETNAPSFLLHDAGGQIADRIISRDNTFYSELLGSPNTVYRQYDSEGCQWPNAIAKGLQLRQYSLAEKPFFLSFKEWWDGANPIFNLSLGYENINDEEVIRIEGKEYQYNETPSVYISNVREITSLYDQERIFKTVKIGYKKWQSEDISGIDDPQTKHTYASRLQKTGSEIALESDFIAASLAIETTRRKTREKSADYKFDNDTFIVAINPNSVDISPETSPDVTDYIPELDENFTNVENLLNSDTRYNLRLTPARNLLRWLGWLSGGLQSYLTSVFKFTSGEGNYDTITEYSASGCDEYQLELSEKQDIEVTSDYYHLANLYEINVPMELSTYLTIRENRQNAIAISQTTTDHKVFFIRELDFYPAKGTATIKAWPKEYFDILFVNQPRQFKTCAPVADLTADNAEITADTTQITADQTEYTL